MKISKVFVMTALFASVPATAVTVNPTQPTATCRSRDLARVEVCHIDIHATINAGVCKLAIAEGNQFIDIDDDEADPGDRTLKKIRLRWKIKADVAGQSFRFTTDDGVEIENNVRPNKDFKKMDSALRSDVSLWKVLFHKTQSPQHAYNVSVEGKAKAGAPWVQCPKFDPIIAND